MAPLKGLATLGMLVFRWAAAISVAISIGMAIGPHVSGNQLLVAIVTQLQQTSSILTLCLLVVCVLRDPSDGTDLQEPHLRHQSGPWR